MSAKKAKTGPEELSCFALDAAGHPEFRYSRYYWKGDGPRTGIASAILAKLTPAGHQAARHDLLLPTSAPGEYAELPYLLERYDATLPAAERNGYPPGRGQDMDVRAVGRSGQMGNVQHHDGGQQVLADKIVQHPGPHLFPTGMVGPISAQIDVELGIGANGFGLHARDVCSDTGAAAALANWLRFTAGETA